MILGTTLYAVSKSSFIVTVVFLDENGLAVIPLSATWSLTDGEGLVINSRTAVVITPLASSVAIVLSGNDLKYSDGNQRVLTVTATYNSIYGVLPLIDSLRFDIADTESGKIGV